MPDEVKGRDEVIKQRLRELERQAAEEHDEPAVEVEPTAPDRGDEPTKDSRPSSPPPAAESTAERERGMWPLQIRRLCGAGSVVLITTFNSGLRSAHALLSLFNDAAMLSGGDVEMLARLEEFGARLVEAEASWGLLMELYSRRVPPPRFPPKTERADLTAGVVERQTEQCSC